MGVFFVMAAKALEGIKVLEYAHFVAGPYCAKLLSDLGADTIKIEAPGTGDEARKSGPFPGDIPHPRKELLKHGNDLEEQHGDDPDGDQKNVPAFWNHMNSIDYNPTFDQIAMSVRGNSEVWIIDHSTTTAQAKGHTGGKYGKGGDLLYRYGNPETP
jgi:hypothetical protein